VLAWNLLHFSWLSSLLYFSLFRSDFYLELFKPLYSYQISAIYFELADLVSYL
jgi:hypothetical protein